MRSRGQIAFAVKATILATALGIALLLAFGKSTEALTLSLGAGVSLGSMLSSQVAVTRSIHPRATKIAAISKLQLLFILKLPVFAGAAYLASSLGWLAAGYFMIGVVLVYSFLFLGAILSSFAPATYDEVLD